MDRRMLKAAAMMERAAPDVLVIGGGVAALCAAIAARREGARVRLVEMAPRPMRGCPMRSVLRARISTRRTRRPLR